MSSVVHDLRVLFIQDLKLNFIASKSSSAFATPNYCLTIAFTLQFVVHLSFNNEHICLNLES